jgi:hypothetical protein
LAALKIAAGGKMGQICKPPDLAAPPRNCIEHETIRHGKMRDHHQTGGEVRDRLAWDDPDPR